ncbi:TIGR04104 family putative zinc finger protein [Virgibacillus kimchii]
MPICQNCHHKWTWKQTFKKSFTLDTGMKCPNCDIKQYMTSRARKRSTSIPFIVPLIMLGNLIFGTTYFALIALIILIPVIFGIYPFIIELSNKEEALW